MKLANPALFRQQVLIGNRWQDAGNGSTFDVRNPANGHLVDSTPRCSANDTAHAIEAAHAAFPAWRDTPAKTRAQGLRRWFDLILANRDDFATIMVSAQGKPLADPETKYVNLGGLG